MSRAWRILFSILVLVAFSEARAATPVVGGGELVGASNVDVGGLLFNVVFQEGTCTDLFSGCDGAEDFTFTNLTAASGASQALLQQVFLDGALGQFDSDPSLTRGCSDPLQCLVLTPYAISTDGTRVAFGQAQNRVGADGIQGNFASVDFDTTGDPRRTYAVWTVVPEPGTGLMVAAGLAILSMRRRPASAR